MMTRVFLAAGVAALAIASPATGKPDRERDGQTAQTERGGKAQRAQASERRQARAERAQKADRQQRTQRAERQTVRSERVAQRAERQSPRVERQAQRTERREPRVERQAQRIERQQVRGERVQQAENRRLDRQEVRVDRVQRAENRADRRALRADSLDGRLANNGVGYGVGGCPPGLLDKGCMPPGQLKKLENWARIDERRATRQALRVTRLAALDNRIANQFIEPVRVRSFIGAPLSTVSAFAPLAVVPSSISYLYPDNDDYYYRYGGGYVYRVERDNDLIDYILPLLAGGLMPGQYLPSSYMNSFVPNSYGLNSFYPASYGSYGNDYGYGYQNLCNRYYNGVVYQVDCGTGLIADVVPLYASGYGVGQMLPSSYAYYNVPSQYRSLYYNTNDSNYWYAPGAIYQYDPSNSLITSVAALLSPGFAIGQPLPTGYGMYNVPMAYRQTYYDTPNAWYRYNNGQIYQVDPATQLVTAIVASILT